MTYFSFTPESLKHRNLKIAIVFIHETSRFEVWIAGSNKQFQSKYWNLFIDSSWDKYYLVSSIEGADTIIEHTLTADSDFRDLDALTKQIEGSTLEFIDEVEDFLSRY